MKSVRVAFSRFSLSHKLISLLAAVFIGSLLIVIQLMSVSLSEHAVKIIEAKAEYLIDTMTAVRDYTDVHIYPIVAPLNAHSDEFMPEAIPFYSAKQVFANLQANPDYARYSYREASLNPTNPDDLADFKEARLIESFRADPSLKVFAGDLKTSEGVHHFVAKPVRVNDLKCLQCHSTHQSAPASLISTYGKDNGFGWQLGEVIGAQIVSVPVEAIYNAKHSMLLKFGMLNVVSFIITALCLLVFLGRAIVKPMKMISARAFEASIHPEAVQFPERQRQDEIGLMAQSIDRMKQSLMIAMRILKQSEDTLKS